MDRRTRRSESGQAVIEAALVLPVVLLMGFGVVMVGRVTHAKVAIQAAAREAGRAYATAPSADQAAGNGLDSALRVAEGYGLALDRFDANVQGGFQRGSTVNVRTAYRVPLGDLPLLSLLEVSLTATHAERVELYRSRPGGPP